MRENVNKQINFEHLSGSNSGVFTIAPLINYVSQI
jgi:hypothetical protein